MPPIMPSADRGVIGGSGRSRPQESHSTPTRNQCQSRRETEKKRIQGLHTINLLQALRFCCTWALLKPHMSFGVIKPLMWELHDACVRPCALIPCRYSPAEAGGHHMLPLVWSVAPVARRPACHASRRPLWSPLERPGRGRNVRPRPKNYCSPAGRGNDGGLTSGAAPAGRDRRHAVRP